MSFTVTVACEDCGQLHQFGPTDDVGLCTRRVDHGGFCGGRLAPLAVAQCVVCGTIRYTAGVLSADQLGPCASCGGPMFPST